MKTVTIKPFHGAPITLDRYRFQTVLDRFEINHEDWACSDYARRFHGFVAYLRHFSDGEFSSFGQFITPFVVTSADITINGENVTASLEHRLRSDALLAFAVDVITHYASPNVTGTVTTSGEFAGEWFTTTGIPVDQVLRERGFTF